MPRSRCLGRASLFVLLATAAAPAAAQTPDTTYDRFADSTRVSLAMSVSGDYLRGLSFGARYEFAGRVAPTPPDSITLMIAAYTSRSISREWRFLQRHTLILLLDDTVRVNLGTVQYDTIPQSSSRLEAMRAPIPVALFRRIASAGKLEGRIGDETFTLSPVQLAALRRMAEGTGTASATTAGSRP